MLKTIGLLFVIPAALFAQDAKIMIVERSDSQKLAKAYREYKDALKRWQEVKSDVANGYTQENGKILPGWENIQFSVDFRALVPKSSQYAANGCYWGTGTILTTNATGNLITATVGSDLDVVTDLRTQEK